MSNYRPDPRFRPDNHVIITGDEGQFEHGIAAGTEGTLQRFDSDDNSWWVFLPTIGKTTWIGQVDLEPAIQPVTGDELDAAIASITGVASVARKDSIAKVIESHCWTYPDSFCDCNAYIEGTWKGFAEHLATVLDEELP